MQSRRGILAIFNNIASGRETEFEHWFQHEHLTERLAVPGFLLGRRHEAVSGSPRYFNYYLTASPDVLRSDAYLARVNDPTPLTQTVMAEIFRDMNRTVCEQVHEAGRMRGANVIAARFSAQTDFGTLQAQAGKLLADPAVAHGEIWRAVDTGVTPSEEERLRGGDARITACLLVETLRLPDAEKIAGHLAIQFPEASIGVYRLLCEIRSKGE